MNNILPTDTPREDWTLDQLGQFAQQIAKRTAHNAWLLGRAYTIAKAKAKAEGKKIETWQKEWLPFVSQPTLSRYEAVSKLPEEEVVDKGLTEVYRLIGIVSKKTGPAEADAPTNPFPAGESQQKTSLAEAEDASTEAALEGEPQQATTFKVLPVEPAGEPDSLLKRLAPVVALLTSIVRDLPSLDTTLDATSAINDTMALLQQIRAGLEQKVAA
jgi:hypothetical protein